MKQSAQERTCWEERDGVERAWGRLELPEEWPGEGDGERSEKERTDEERGEREAEGKDVSRIFLCSALSSRLCSLRLSQLTASKCSLALINCLIRS